MIQKGYKEGIEKKMVKQEFKDMEDECTVLAFTLKVFQKTNKK